MFTSLPKDFRDAVLEMQSQQNTLDPKRFAREIMATISRLRLEAATKELADKRIFGGSNGETSEIDLLEKSTQMVEAIRAEKPRP